MTQNRILPNDSNKFPTIFRELVTDFQRFKEKSFLISIFKRLVTNSQRKEIEIVINFQQKSTIRIEEKKQKVTESQRFCTNWSGKVL